MKTPLLAGLLAALAAASAWSAQPPPRRAPSQGREQFGVVSAIQFLQDGGDGPALSKTKELGVGWVRVGLSWSIVQPRKTGHEPADFDFSFTDQMIENARQNGIKVFATLGDAPAWAAPCSACMPTDLDDWYWYVRRVVEHYEKYGDDVTFGVWNEPNDTYFLSDFGSKDHKRSNPSLYVRLANMALKARADGNPKARIGIMEMTGAVFNKGLKFWDDTWFDEAWPNIAGNLLPQDVVTIHNYPPDDDAQAMWDFMAETNKHTGRRETWITEVPGGKAAGLGSAFVNRPAGLANFSKVFVYRLWDGQEFSDESLTKPDWSNRPSFDDYHNLIVNGTGGGHAVPRPRPRSP